MIIYTLVQARLGSTRLPRKVLKDIAGQSMIERVMERAQQIGPPVVVVAPSDPELSIYCLERDWLYCVGPEEDVLARYANVAEGLHADHVVRVTSDCPFLDVEAAKLTLAEHLHGGYDLTTYHLAEGRGVQVFKASALIRAAELATEMFRHSPDVWFLTGYGPWKVHHVRFSVDTEEDLETARRRAEWLARVTTPR